MPRFRAGKFARAFLALPLFLAVRAATQEGPAHDAGVETDAAQDVVGDAAREGAAYEDAGLQDAAVEADADAGAAPPGAGPADVAGPDASEEAWQTPAGAAGEEDEYASGSHLQTNDVVVTGQRLIDPAEAPVEAFSVSEQELERQQPVSANDVLQRVPGVSVRAEEGMGLRPNIGFRGLSADRSRNVLVLEDGVPVQMMPYDYPELYVAPRIERMRSVEVVRGAASLIYGPRTLGGVVNFVTLAPPPKLHLSGEFRAGTGGYYFGFASAGDTIGDVGFLVTAMHQNFDGPRHLGLSQTDLMGRLSIDLHHAGELRIKLQFYDEDSASTNLGLTTLQFQNGLNENFAYHDRFPIRRYAAQATHQIEFSRKVTLATTGYFNFTTRDWWRQNYLRQSASGVAYERIVGPDGQTYGPNSGMGTNDGSSVYFLQSDVGRLRRYTVAGVEPRLTARYGGDKLQGELISGVRLHYERGDDRDVAGDSPTARSGDLQNKDLREVAAFSFYARPTFEFFERRLEIAPALRVESMFTFVHTYRAITTAGGVVDGAYQQPVVTAYDPAQDVEHTLVAVIPGISAVGHVSDLLALFAGMHRGFVPPGIRDAIVGDDRTLQLQPEWAWNYAAGARAEPRRWLRYEATAFYIDYIKQVLAPNVANTPPSGIVPSGRSKSYGFEASTRLDLATAASLGFELPLTVAYTYAQAHFGSGWAPGIDGKVVPYVPTHTLSGRIDFAHPFGVEAQLSVNYMSARYTDPYNLIEPTLDGTAGLIGANTVVNARVAYHYKPWYSTVFVEARNLFDARYIASRAPDGIQPGMTRQVFAGVRVEY